MKRLSILACLIFINLFCSVSESETEMKLYIKFNTDLHNISVHLEGKEDSVEYVNKINEAIEAFPDSLNFYFMKAAFYSLNANHLGEYNNIIEEIKRVEKIRYGNITMALLKQIINYKHIGFTVECDSLFTLIEREFFNDQNYKNANNYLIATVYVKDRQTFQIILEDVLKSRSEDEKNKLLFNISGFQANFKDDNH